MELHQLRYFVAVAHTGNFTRAAERCHVSQPSLSQQILKLERRLGRRLFDRLGKRAVLTEAGAVLLEQATRILAAVDNAERQMKDFDRVGGGQFSVGAIPTLAPYILPAVLKTYARQFPSVELTIHEDLTAHLVAAAAAGEIDLALVALPVHDERLASEELFTEPLLLALPQGHALLARPKLTLEDVRDERFILLDEMHCLGEQILVLCRDKGCQRIACRSTQLATVQTLIALGLGVSLLPAMAQAADRSRRVAYRRLTGAQPTRTIAAVWHRDRYHSTAAERFLAMLKEQITANAS